MRCIFFLLLSLCTFFSTNSQSISRITSFNKNPKPEVNEQYFYEPPKGMLLPDSLEVLIAYPDKPYSNSKYVHLIKSKGRYKFEYTAKKFSFLLLFTIVDARIKLSDYSPAIVPKKKVIDNNNGRGFIIHLYNDNGNLFANDAIQWLGLIQDWVYYMDLTEISKKMLIERYELAYQKYPELKEEASYVDYLTIMYKEKKEEAKATLLNYAIDKVKKADREIDLLNAAKIFALLKMNEEKQAAENKALEKYPFGELAKEKYWQNRYALDNKIKVTEQALLTDMNEYISKFNDSSRNGFFYTKIISLLFDTADWNGGLKYQQFVSDNPTKAYINDKYALKLADPKIESPGTSLEIAKMLSKKSLDNINAEKRSKTSGWSMADLLGVYYKYLNTYALIFYKQHQYDSAFYYQGLMYQKSNVLNTEGLQRYAVYAEKVKGVSFAKQVLEQQLLSGVKSSIMLDHLQAIYKQLNLPKDEFDNLQKKNKLLAEQKDAASIKRKLGTTKATDFKLKNLSGEVVSLSALKNKVVVLDFWATWCAPCKASFPEMQKLVDKYKADTGVVFLFIDVWETKDPKKTREIVANYMKDNSYTFNVLFDEKEVIVKDYKIAGIPSKFVINKNGNIVFMSDNENYLEDISVVIETAKQKENSQSEILK
jgi:thiol-disulfide isomerase/thioredoxin